MFCFWVTVVFIAPLGLTLKLACFTLQLGRKSLWSSLAITSELVPRQLACILVWPHALALHFHIALYGVGCVVYTPVGKEMEPYWQLTYIRCQFITMSYTCLCNSSPVLSLSYHLPRAPRAILATF